MKSLHYFWLTDQLLLLAKVLRYLFFGPVLQDVMESNHPKSSVYNDVSEREEREGGWREGRELLTYIIGKIDVNIV